MQLRTAPLEPPAATDRPLAVAGSSLFRWAVGAIVAVNVANALNLLFLEDTHDWLLAVERNPSTWLAAAILATGAACAWLVSQVEPGGRWGTVAVLLALMSVDEVAAFHERFGTLPAAPRVGPRAWVAVGVLLVVGVAVALVPWVLGQSLQVRLALLGGAAVFLTGAIGFEQLAGWWVDEHGDDRMFFVLSTVEENLEYAGALWATSGIATRLRGVRVVLG